MIIGGDLYRIGSRTFKGSLVAEGEFLSRAVRRIGERVSLRRRII